MSITRIRKTNNGFEREVYRTYSTPWLAARETRRARRAADPKVQARAAKHLAAGRVPG